MRRLLAVVLLLTALTGCGTPAQDPLQVTNNPHAATPANAPRSTTRPTGTVLPAPPTTLLAYDQATRTLAAANTTPRLTLLTPHTPAAPRTLDLPGPPTSLRTTGPATLLAAIPSKNLIATVDLRSTRVTTTPAPDGPTDALPLGNGLATAHRATRAVTLADHGTATGFSDDLTLTPTATGVAVLDRVSTAITPLGDDGSKQAGLRAGEGTTHADTDRYQRIIATDTRGDALLAFSTDPLVMKQRFPVPGAPYGLSLDNTHDLAWVTLTARNELVGYDIAGGEPTEKHRTPTVHQPDAVANDPATGTVFVASATGDGIQVFTP